VRHVGGGDPLQFPRISQHSSAVEGMATELGLAFARRLAAHSETRRFAQVSGSVRQHVLELQLETDEPEQ
jgi:hypothetical protein